ncbi:Las1-like protein [Schizosaccharomyces japonicus yFS275]|uniref:Las1-like protein n=1 Tax=Schizosaccharomyces japonicus (strain yFS275 / FY16936) TaxID=402676 RepID=B6JYC0_SCHJY|nr:Las1-like protein [Schizosaccharomyces japonicus yFS275]EEB06538.1 Las1-like protein [Schizosaccharomyces japonicus yFS275]
MDYKVVPWRSTTEFLYLMSCFYAEDGTGEPPEAQSLYRGVEIVRAWSTRGRVPHSVESTSQLVMALLTEGPSQRLSLALSLSRFVSGLLDPIQQSQFAIPMSTLAKTLGLPAFFVEIRHAITHEELPSLPVLRVAAQRALQWLYEHYWIVTASVKPEDVEETERLNETAKTQVQTEIAQLLKTWRTWRKSHLHVSTLKSKNQQRYVKRALAVVDSIITIANTRLSYIPASIVNDELQNDLTFALETTNLQYVIDCFLEKKALIPAGVNDIRLFPSVQKLWIVLIQAITEEQPHFLPGLIGALWSEIDEYSKAEEEDPWTRVKMSKEDEEKDEETRSALSFYAKWYSLLVAEAYTDQPWARSATLTQTQLASVLETCLQRSDPYTRIIIDDLVSLDEELEKRYKPLCAFRGDQIHFVVSDENEQGTNDAANVTIEQMRQTVHEFSQRLSSIAAPSSENDASVRVFANRKWVIGPEELVPIGQVIR